MIRTTPPHVRATFRTHVLLIKEMGPADDVANVRSCNILRRTLEEQGLGLDIHRSAAGPMNFADTAWIARAAELLLEAGAIAQIA